MRILIVLVLVTQLFSQKINAIPWPIKTCDVTSYNYTQGSMYETNLINLLNNLHIKSSSVKFHRDTVGNGSDQVYGFFLCRFDVGLGDCSSCVEDATGMIVDECPLNGVAILWPDDNESKCLIRYANRNIFSLWKTDPIFLGKSEYNITNSAEFYPILNKTMNELINNASSASSHFAFAKTSWTSIKRLYSYAQCIPDIDSLMCLDCLKIALDNIMDCCKQLEGAKALLPSCQLRFEIKPFLNETFMNEMQLSPSSPSPETPVIKPPPTRKRPMIIAAVAVCSTVGLIILSVVFWICFCRKKREEASGYVPTASPTGRHDGAEILGETEFVQYDFATLNTATDNFSAKNDLGKGGFGTVYKGTIENGQQLAIKRLSGTSAQGTKEFMTEARLLAKLQHKNLVKLSGFCSEGEEKLLVYEFMPNSSLDGRLFDPKKRPLLEWVTRYKIVMGIARGLLYLHEDSRLRIIHRDLKPGNILLDEEMNPKIADFGLAKLFEVTQKIGTTSRIAGTPGYMAPEYMATGEYSVKSDVYSYGIMILEIVSGLNNVMFYQSQQRKDDLAVYAWKLWNEKRTYELTDPMLFNNSSENEVIRCIQIGLLCLQANPDQRPTMGLVFSMLTGSGDLPLPSEPAMSFPQFNMPLPFNDVLQSDTDQYSTRSITRGTDVSQDMYQGPR